MIGIIDVGGGLRGVYGAGILDYCLKYQIRFDRLYGVSAGAANLISYAAGHRSRTFRFYTEYAFRKEYMGIINLVRTGNYINLDYIYDVLSAKGGEDPLDLAAAKASGMELTVVATDADTAKPFYFHMEDISEGQFGALKASACVPVANTPYPFQGHFWYDGGVSDPIPIEKALEDGCDKVIVILTRPLDTLRDPADDTFAVKKLAKTNPVMAKAVENRASLYNEQVRRCKDLAKEGKVLILAPETTFGMKTLTKDKEIIKRLYRLGQDDAPKIAKFLHLELTEAEG